MRRGRWVVYCFALFLCFFCVQSSWGISLSVTATVPLSPLWKEALRLNSQAKIDTSHPHILLISQQSLGIENIPVDKQDIQLLIFKNNVLVNEQEKMTNKKGAVDFIYVSGQADTYSVIIVNKTETYPFVVKSSIASL